MFCCLFEYLQFLFQLGWPNCSLLLRRWLLNGCVLHRSRRSVGRSFAAVRVGGALLLDIIYLAAFTYMIWIRCFVCWRSGFWSYTLWALHTCVRSRQHTCVCGRAFAACIQKQQSTAGSEWIESGERIPTHPHGKLLNQVVIETKRKTYKESMRVRKVNIKSCTAKINCIRLSFSPRSMFTVHFNSSHVSPSLFRFFFLCRQKRNKMGRKKNENENLNLCCEWK